MVTTFEARGPWSKFFADLNPASHDPVAVAAVLHREGIEPSLDFTPANHLTDSITVDVVTAGQHGDESELGRTARKRDSEGKHVYLPSGLNVAAFWKCLNGCLDRADKVSSMGRK